MALVITNVIANVEKSLVVLAVDRAAGRIVTGVGLLTRTHDRRRRVTFMVVGIVILIILYLLTYQKFSYFIAKCTFLFFNFKEPQCPFAEKLTKLVATDVLVDGFTNLLSLPLHPPSGQTVISQATVFYVWCGVDRRWFQFRNYLSVRSVLRTLRPDTIWFYYESEPVLDRRLYNTWWQELTDDVPFFHREHVHVVSRQLRMKACDDRGRPSVDFVYELVTSRGGTFVDESTIVVSRPPDDQLTVAVDTINTADIRLRLLKAHRSVSCPELPFSRSSQNVLVVGCPSHSQLNDQNITLCFHLAQSLYPKDIWWSNNTVSRILRLQFYGSSDVRKLLPSYDRLAPNVGHVVWVDGGEMDFLFFLCVVSLLHVAKVDMVYIHGDRPPTGVYWNLLMNTGQKVQHVLREDVRQVFVILHSGLCK